RAHVARCHSKHHFFRDIGDATRYYSERVGIMSLRDLVMRSAKHTPETLAVKGADKSMTYAELDSLANRFARVLIQCGVRRGDCVGIWLEKSTSVVVAMQAALRLGAIYVPLDPLSPAARIRTILRDCSVQVLVTT